MKRTSSWVETQLQPALTLVNPRRQVGIFGGNFNPIHYAHLLVADQVAQQLLLERVYFMPEAIPPHAEQKATIDSEHRLAMIERAIEGNHRLGIELLEVQRGGISYTFETMKQLTEMNPDTDYYLILGADMVLDLPKWHRVSELVELVQFVGVRRPGYVGEPEFSVIWVDVPLLEISSTAIRSMILSGNSPLYLTSAKVIQYIQEKGLYLNEKE